MENNTVTIQDPVSFSEAALIEIKKLMESQDLRETPYMRIGVKGGGCSGLSYVLGFDKKEEQDEIFDIQGIPVIIQPAHKMYLVQMQIDYSNGLDARGFVFNNPNASSSCGCGSSFAV
ncbi:MAG: iron-sulfur cluster assembly accessory protein [Taibaiella sp.]|nr:iron-sulfur cluster assembly accessory protein [Taibaiella sp.]